MTLEFETDLDRGQIDGYNEKYAVESKPQYVDTTKCIIHWELRLITQRAGISMFQGTIKKVAVSGEYEDDEEEEMDLKEFDYFLDFNRETSEIKIEKWEHPSDFTIHNVEIDFKTKTVTATI